MRYAKISTVDAWRVLNPDARRYTTRQTQPAIHCRLDFFLISHLKINEHEFVTSDSKILAECESFYKELYTSNENAILAEREFLQPENAKTTRPWTTMRQRVVKDL